MTYRLRIKPPAVRDILEIRNDYGAVSSDLAERFEFELLRVLEQIESMPTIHAQGDLNCRQACLRRFPQVVTYLLDGETVVVLAVLHGHRDPEMWKRRAEL